MRPLRHDDMKGTKVSVVLDCQRVIHSETRSKPWAHGDHMLVLLKGFRGGYLVKRCSVFEEGEEWAWRG